MGDTPATIVILSRDAANLQICLDAITANDPGMNVLVVDDGVEWSKVTRTDKVRTVAGINPFVFARNANIGIREAGGDVILLNDDAALKSPNGFSNMARTAKVGGWGLMSAAIDGLVCNPEQQPQSSPTIRPERFMLAFMAIYIGAETVRRIGQLDERYAGYGCEDRDYCLRAAIAGVKMGIFDGCVVEHPASGSTSNYRARADHDFIYAENRLLFDRKWRGFDLDGFVGGSVQSNDRIIDMMYSARNRLEFVKESFAKLRDNTDWFYVNKLFVYDDGSEDGTLEWLTENLAQLADTQVELIQTSIGHTVALMGDWVDRARAAYLAKVDSDVCVPPGWLEATLSALKNSPDYDLVGIEPVKGWADCETDGRFIERADFIGGIGMFRRSIFLRHGLPKPGESDMHAGFQGWQWSIGGVERGWVKPGLPVLVLDKLDCEPWRSLTREYVQRGWQRAKNIQYRDPKLWEWAGWPVEAVAQ